MKTLTVICPVYNEEEIINIFYAELKKVLTGLSDRYDSKILFVMDWCTDTTPDILKKIAEKDKTVQLIILSSRFGHQMSLLAGIDHSFSDAVVMMDSDMQHPPALIPKMLELFEKGYDVVYTAREYSSEIGFFRRLSSDIFYRLLNYLSTIPIISNAADFRLISRRVAEVFRTQIRERNLFLRGLFSWVGFRSALLPFQTGIRLAGKSKYSTVRLLKFGVQGIVSFSKRPLQAAVVVGFIFALFGILQSLYAFIEYFVVETIPSGFTTLSILISMFSGVQLIFLGIIGEYIGAIFDEVKARPHYIIEEEINF